MSDCKKTYLKFFNLIITIWVVQGVFYHHEISASAPDITTDYFWGSASIRTHKLTCEDDILQIICRTKCGAAYDCFQGTCYCSKQKPDPIKIIEGTWDDVEKLLEAYANNKNVESYDSDASHLLRTKDEEVKQEEEPTEHPALRHHIAHFCPNLNVARECIRKCMKIGKPAFCGKDHSCYCGHRYSSHDEAQPLDIDDTYLVYRDLYEKYFGPQESKNDQEV